MNGSHICYLIGIAEVDRIKWETCGVVCQWGLRAVQRDRPREERVGKNSLRVGAARMVSWLCLTISLVREAVVGRSEASMNACISIFWTRGRDCAGRGEKAGKISWDEIKGWFSSWWGRVSFCSKIIRMMIALKKMRSTEVRWRGKRKLDVGQLMAGENAGFWT